MFFSSSDIRAVADKQVYELLNLVKNACDLVMAVNWLPAGFLWAEKISMERNAIFGVVSSVLGTGLMLADEWKQRMEKKDE